MLSKLSVGEKRRLPREVSERLFPSSSPSPSPSRGPGAPLGSRSLVSDPALSSDPSASQLNLHLLKSISGLSLIHI